MNFTITKLEIENFRSIQDKVTLNVKSGLFSIEGINYTETNSTNGSGKSTLISALFCSLFQLCFLTFSTGSCVAQKVTQDQSEYFFRRMSEAGWKWDSERKELTKTHRK